MTPRQIALVRGSWKRVLPIKDEAGALFYQRLVELDPDLESLFSVSMADQGKKLMAMIGMVVAHLDRLGEMLPAVEQLGRRHAEYGVQDAHYDLGASALLWTLRAGLGDALTPEAEEAWAIAYATLTGVMRQASATMAVAS